MHEHTEPDHTLVERRGTALGPRRPGLRPADLPAENSPWHDPTVSKIRVVVVGAAGQSQAITLADLLEFEPAAGTSVVLCEVGRWP